MGVLAAVMYDDGQHEFLYLDMHDFQLCEGGAPKEQPAAVSRGRGCIDGHLCQRRQQAMVVAVARSSLDQPCCWAAARQGCCHAQGLP